MLPIHLLHIRTTPALSHLQNTPKLGLPRGIPAPPDPPRTSVLRSSPRRLTIRQLRRIVDSRYTMMIHENVRSCILLRHAHWYSIYTATVIARKQTEYVPYPKSDIIPDHHSNSLQHTYIHICKCRRSSMERRYKTYLKLAP